MYSEALKQIRESKPEKGKVAEAGAPPKRGRKMTPAERAAFYERFTRKAPAHSAESDEAEA